MGKREKKKAARNAEKHKDKRVHNSSLKAQDDASVLQKEEKACVHLHKAVDLHLVSSKIESTLTTACHLCTEAVNHRRPGKGSKKKASPHHKATWVCLQCGVFSCGGVSFPNTPQTHALRHVRQFRHPLVIQLENPRLRWCFSCSTLLPVDKVEDTNTGEPKDVFFEIVELLKHKSTKVPSVDVEDIWFGSGSGSGNGSRVIEVKAENKAVNGENEKESYAVRGLVNLGNTCFFNSVMQNLLAMDTLREYLLNFEGSMGPLMSSLKKIFVETSLESGRRNVINPKPLFGCVCAKAPQFRGYQQQDSHELLRYLLDGLSSEDLHAKKLETSSCGRGRSQPSFVDAIFGGQTSSTVCCVECGHSSVVYETFLDLSLPLPTRKPPSKKPQLISRTKKKYPLKRGGKIRPKLNKNGDTGPVPSVSNTSTCTQSSSGLKSDSLTCTSSVDLADPSILVHENAMPHNSHSTESGCTSAQEPQSASLDADGVSWLSDNKPVSQGDSVQEADCFTWMDYLEPVSLLDVPNLVAVSENFSLPHELERLDANHDSVYMQNIARPSVEDTLFQNSGEEGDSHDAVYVPDTSKSGGEVCVNPEGVSPEDVNLKLESTVNDWSDECPQQVQDNEILLLTYKEDVIEGEEIKTDAEISSSAICDGEDTLGFDGLGDLFNEPEAGVNNMQVSEHLGNGFLVENSTDSDPDEVDDTDSPVSVESCLAHFIKPELLTGEHAWHCENCSKLLKEERERERMGNNQQNTASILGDISNDVCCHPFQDSTVLLANCNNGSWERDDNLKKLDARQINGLSLNLQQEQEIGCTSESVDFNASGSAVCFKMSDETSLDGESLDSHVVHCNHAPVERPSRPIEEQELGEDEKKEKDLKCDKVMRDATKRILINKIPPLLTIHLKRFGQDAHGRLSKLNGHVGFKEYIDLGPYMDCRSTEEGDNCIYRLVGVVEHSGSMRGGHYVAYVRGGHRRRAKSEEENREGHHSVWYHASDTYVCETTLEEVCRCEAYLLFYEKVKP